MTKLLDDAMAELAKLPKDEQDSVARWLLEELASEKLWERLFADSDGYLAGLADKALAEYQRGRTEELDPSAL